MPRSSRHDWTGIIFVPHFSLGPDGIRITRWQMIRNEEMFIPYSRISTLYLRAGLFFVEVEIHVDGLSEPITTRMLKSDARALQREVLARMQ